MIFRQRDIDRMQASDVTLEFVEYFDRLSDERKLALAESLPDLVKAAQAWERQAAAQPAADHSPSVQEAEPAVLEPVAQEHEDDTLTAIRQSIYEGRNVSELPRSDPGAIEALTLEDWQIERELCPVHRIRLSKYNPSFHMDNGGVKLAVFFACPECNRLFVKRSRLESVRRDLTDAGVPHRLYDWEISKRYLLTQLKAYELCPDDTIYIQEPWIEENPSCPIHQTELYPLPCDLRYRKKQLHFDAFLCAECDKVILRRTAALDLEDRCAQEGIPQISFENLVQKKPRKEAVSKREINPDYLMDAGKRLKNPHKRIENFYLLTEDDTIVVSDAACCNLDGHDSETVLGLVWILERASNKKHSYLFMLGYCAECQKYYMDEMDYRTVYQIGRLEAAVIMDVDDADYMITSGEVFDLENQHLKDLEGEIRDEIEDIHSQPDYVNPYAVIHYYDDGANFYNKAVSREKYADRLDVLSSYQGKPYEYRVDLVADGETEVYYVGAADIDLEKGRRVISANSKFGRELIHYQTVKVRKNGRDYAIKLSRQFDINDASLYGYANLRTDEDIIFRSGVTDPFLVRVLNMRKKQHNLIDIFVTIQEKQNQIVDAKFARNIIVQGCAGSGKTMVLLHRLSSLKYQNSGFDFQHDALILTPNDRFTLHIKGLAEQLQIGYIRRSSVEQYYRDTLAEYSSELVPGRAIASEMTVPQIFVDHVYSDSFRADYDRAYEEVLSKRDQMIAEAYQLADQMNARITVIREGNDSDITASLNRAAGNLNELITVSEQAVKNANETVKRLQDRQEWLSEQIPQKRQDISSELRRCASAAQTLAMSAIEGLNEKQIERQKTLQQLAGEKESLEQILADSQGEADQPFEEFLQNNTDWITADVSTQLDRIHSDEDSLSEKQEAEENLRLLLDVSTEDMIAAGESSDEEITAILVELTEALEQLAALQQERQRLENSWIPFGRARRLAETGEQIQTAEGVVEEKQTALLNAMEERRSLHEQISRKISELQMNLTVRRGVVRAMVAENKQNTLRGLKDQIQKTDSSLQAEARRIEKYEDAVLSLDEEMTEDALIVWLNEIELFAPAVRNERRGYLRLTEELEKLESEATGTEADLSLAMEHRDAALSGRYSAEIRRGVRALRNTLVQYSASEICQTMFAAAVHDFQEQNGIDSLPAGIHRYDLYARLIFAMRYYGKAANNVRFLCVDEGQDLALNEYRLIQELNSSRLIMNVFGDTNQLMKLHRGIADWQQLEELVNADRYELNENYRNTNQITRFCNDSFEMSMLQTGVDGAKVREIAGREFADDLSAHQVTTERVAILIPRSVRKKNYIEAASAAGDSGEELGNGKIAVMYVDEVKGIEFDRVYVFPAQMGRNEKYIAYTRALSELIVVVNE